MAHKKGASSSRNGRNIYRKLGVNKREELIHLIDGE